MRSNPEEELQQGLGVGQVPLGGEEEEDFKAEGGDAEIYIFIHLHRLEVAGLEGIVSLNSQSSSHFSSNEFSTFFFWVSFFGIECHCRRNTKAITI